MSDARVINALVLEPGVGERCAIWAGAPDAQKSAAGAGLNPVLVESGNYQGRSSISKQGHPQLRSALYMATGSAIRANPRIKAFYEKLLSRAKSKKAALVACSRKLLMFLYGILNAHLKGETTIYRDFRGKQVKGKKTISQGEPLTI